MQWNRAVRERKRQPVEYDEPRPTHTLPRHVLLRIFKWNWKHLKKAQYQHGFPVSIRTGVNAAWFNPDEVNRWLSDRGGDMTL